MKKRKKKINSPLSNNHLVFFGIVFFADMCVCVCMLCVVHVKWNQTDYVLACLIMNSKVYSLNAPFSDLTQSLGV